MGWYDDEEGSGLPAWAVEPAMWFGCLLVAVMPAALLAGLWRVFFGPLPVAAGFLVYVAAVVGFVAVIKPWSTR